MLEQDGTDGTYIFIIERARVGLAHPQHLLTALVFLLRAYAMGDVEGLGPRALAVAEDVVLTDGQAVHEVQSLAEEFVGLAPHAHDDVDADEGIGHQLAYAHHLLFEECRVVAPVHQSQHLVAARLQGHMEVWHEGAARGTELQYLVGQQVGFDAADAIAFDALHPVQCAYEVGKRLPRGASEVADVHARQHDFLSALPGNVLGLCHQRGHRAVAATSPCEGYGAIGAEIVAPVLHLQEVSRAVATGARGHKVASLTSPTLFILSVPHLCALCLLCALCEEMNNHFYGSPLLLRTQHQVDPFYARDVVGLQLGIASRHHHEGAGMLAYEFVYGLPALVVGHLGDAARIDVADVGRLALLGVRHAQGSQTFGHGSRLGKVQLTAQCEIYGTLPCQK